MLQRRKHDATAIGCHRIPLCWWSVLLGCRKRVAMRTSNLIPLAQAEKKVYDVVPPCECGLAMRGGDQPTYPSTKRVVRGSLSLLLCTVCGRGRDKEVA